MTEEQKAPERIWVRVGDHNILYEQPECSDEFDVHYDEYVRADLAQPVAVEVKPELINACKGVLTWRETGVLPGGDLGQRRIGESRGEAFARVADITAIQAMQAISQITTRPASEIAAESDEVARLKAENERLRTALELADEGGGGGELSAPIRRQRRSGRWRQ